MSNTYTWLYDSLKPALDETVLMRGGRIWTHVAGFSSCGSIFAVYRDTMGYCVHAGDTWPEDAEPSLGYFEKGVTWNQLVAAIAARYDEIRDSRQK